MPLIDARSPRSVAGEYRASVGQSDPLRGRYAQPGQTSTPLVRSRVASQCGQRCCIRIGGHIDDTNRFPRQLSKSRVAFPRFALSLSVRMGSTISEVGFASCPRRIGAVEGSARTRRIGQRPDEERRNRTPASAHWRGFEKKLRASSAAKRLRRRARRFRARRCPRR